MDSIDMTMSEGVLALGKTPEAFMSKNEPVCGSGMDAECNEEHTPDIPEGPLDLLTLLDEISKQLHACKTLPLSARLKIKQLLSQYDASLGELDRYAHFDAGKKYTRNLIACDETFTLMLLCWNPGKESPIHDHPCHGCWMRVTTGNVEETRYVIDSEANKLNEISKGAASPGDCIYIDDNVGLHKVRNPSSSVPACTLHLYSPPFARCNIWLDASAPADKLLRPVVTYHSEYGQLNACATESALTADK